MSEKQGVPPWLNRTMKSVLRSPLHGIISNTITLITFNGRKSGKAYTTPVSYYQRGNQVRIFTHGNWWKNLVDSAPVSLRIRGKDLKGLAEPVVEDKKAIAAELCDHLRQSSFDARFYDVTIDRDGNPDPRDVEQAVETVVMIRVVLN
ncbi:MAG: nitroreductase family deazaflavin-dependent oxidoreductase [Anaerolineales bacterium]|nr:nitroreductase family deazaflavin-dependent oxidoreductase [Anaerolineales bacterium]